MDISTAKRIDGLLSNEVFPSFINPIDFHNVIELKQKELFVLLQTGDRNRIEKCVFEYAAITINFLESGVLKP